MNEPQENHGDASHAYAMETNQAGERHAFIAEPD